MTTRGDMGIFKKKSELIGWSVGRSVGRQYNYTSSYIDLNSSSLRQERSEED